jgi:beta-phosphoglucomutase
MVLVRALIFDMDGVLIHSNPWHARVWREFCRRHGLEIPEDQIQWMYGRRNGETVRARLGGYRREAEIQRLGREKESW